MIIGGIIMKNMKRIICLIAAAIMAVSMLAGCVQNGGNTSAGISAIESLKTLKDAFDLKIEDGTQVARCGDYLVYAFELNNTWYRVISELTADASEELDKLDWSADDFDQKMKSIVSSLNIIRYENVSDMIIPQAELDKLVGKTVGELFDSDWYSSGWDLEKPSFSIGNSGIVYEMTVNETIENTGDFEEDDLLPLTVKSLKFNYVSDATNIELDDDGKLI